MRTKSPKWQPIDDAQVTQWVNFLTPTGCFEWTGSRSAWGYGMLGRWDPETGKSVKTGAHKYVYEQLFGSLPEGWEVDHLCSNKLCVNPQHLEGVPKAENVRRGAKNRRVKPRVTHCPRGHLKVFKCGQWTCMECRRQAHHRYRAKKGLPVGLGLGGHQSSKTHCKRGHEFTQANTITRKDHPGRRQCRACHYAQAKARYHARKSS